MKTKILKLITYIAVIAFIMFATALDCGSVIPLIVCLLSGSWLVLIAVANTPKGGNDSGSRESF